MGYFIKIGLGMTEIKIKRVYEDPSDTDGYRVLVDRLWPRGMKKEHLKYDYWAKELTPSSGKSLQRCIEKNLKLLIKRPSFYLGYDPVNQ